MYFLTALIVNALLCSLELEMSECSDKTFKVIPKWANGSDAVSCGFAGRQNYQRFHCEGASCNSTCDFKCPKDQRNDTLVYNYIDLFKNANLTKMDKPSPTSPGNGVNFSRNHLVSTDIQDIEILDCTFCVWMKLRKEGQSLRNLLIVRYNIESVPVYLFTVFIKMTSYHSAEIGIQAPRFIFTKTWVVPTEKWVHFAIQTSHKCISVFLNGILQKEIETVIYGIVVSKFAVLQMNIGNSLHYTEKSVDGLLQDFRFYKSTLTNREIKAIVRGYDIIEEDVKTLPYCFCPAIATMIPTIGSPYCINNIEKERQQIRLGGNVHPIQYATDGIYDTFWLSKLQEPDITITAELQHTFEISGIDIRFYSLYPKSMNFINGDGKYWQTFDVDCLHHETRVPCQKFPKIPNSPINWKVNWEYVSHVDFYITPSIQFKFVGFTNEKYPYYGLREVEIHVGCSCNGRSDSCDLSNRPPKCSGCRDAYGDRCQVCAAGYFLPPEIKGGNLTCTSCQCKYAGVLNNTNVCTENQGICVCGKVIDRQECTICREQSGQCTCKQHVTGMRCDRCSDGFYNLTSDNLLGCQPCNCTKDGQNITCDLITGECYCLRHVIGTDCDRCENGFFAKGREDYNANGCQHACNCNPIGSVPGTSCDQFTGQCQCKDGVAGLKCDLCHDDTFYLYNVSNNIGCTSCQCDVSGTNQSAGCDVETGQCACKEHVESRTCSKCQTGFWNLDSNNPSGCEPCTCYLFGTENGSMACDQMDGQCRCKLHHNNDKGQAGRQCKPFISSFEPSKGPWSGGTTLHIYGGFFDESDMPNITIRGIYCALRYVNSSYLLTETPSLERFVNQTRTEVNVTVLYSDGQYHISAQKFIFEKDPFVARVHPLMTIPSGGIMLTVTGGNFGSVFQPFLKTSLFYNESLLETKHGKCVKANDSVMLCNSPKLSMPSLRDESVSTSDVIDGERGIIGGYRVYIGLILDGVATYQNLLNVLPDYGELRLYHDPKFFNFTETNRLKIFRAYSESYLPIQGEHLYLDKHQYRVNIGVSLCEIVRTTSELIECKPPKHQPSTSQLDTGIYPELQVAVGNIVSHVGFVQYYNTVWDDPSVRAGLLSLVVIILVIIIAFCVLALIRVIRRRRRDTDTMPHTVEFQKIPNILDVVEEDMRHNLNSCLLDADCLLLGEVIGKGHFGQVQRAIYENKKLDEQIDVAVKTVRAETCNTDEVLSFLREATLMQEFDHPNVLTLIGVAIQDNLPLVVLPFMEYGDLKSYVSDQKRMIALCELATFGMQIARGMAYLADKHFVHRDLAARNCMLNKLMVVKIADFGLSRDIYQSDYYRPTSGKAQALPVRWMALESIVDGHYSTQSDVWSFGITLWELITRGSTPYPDMPNNALKDNIQQGNRMLKPTHAPEIIYELMLACWHADPTKRPSFHQIANALQSFVETLSGASVLNDYI